MLEENEHPGAPGQADLELHVEAQAGPVTEEEAAALPLLFLAPGCSLSLLPWGKIPHKVDPS